MGSLGWKEDLALHIWPQNRRLFWRTWHTEAERVLAGQIWEKEMVSEKKCGHKGSFSVDHTEWSIHALNHSAFSPCIIYRWKSKNAILRSVFFSRHFSKSKIRRDVNESPWAPGVQAVPAPHGPAQNQPPPGHPLNPTARPTRTLVRKTWGKLRNKKKKIWIDKRKWERNDKKVQCLIKFILYIGLLNLLLLLL